MTKQELAVKSPFVVLGTFTAYMTNTFNELLMVLLAVMAFDYTTGILRGLLTKSINSTIGLKGIFKKIAMIIIIGLTACVEIVAQILGMETNNFLVASVIVFFIINEVISCLENCGQLGAPIPAVLLDTLEKLREVGGKEQKVTRKRKKKEEK
jgi:toxin secretion/phage lysis holin